MSTRSNYNFKSLPFSFASLVYSDCESEDLSESKSKIKQLSKSRMEFIVLHLVEMLGPAFETQLKLICQYKLSCNGQYVISALFLMLNSVRGLPFYKPLLQTIQSEMIDYNGDHYQYHQKLVYRLGKIKTMFFPTLEYDISLDPKENYENYINNFLKIHGKILTKFY